MSCPYMIRVRHSTGAEQFFVRQTFDLLRPEFALRPVSGAGLLEDEDILEELDPLLQALVG